MPKYNSYRINEGYDRRQKSPKFPTFEECFRSEKWWESVENLRVKHKIPDDIFLTKIKNAQRCDAKRWVDTLPNDITIDEFKQRFFDKFPPEIDDPDGEKKRNELYKSLGFIFAEDKAEDRVGYACGNISSRIEISKPNNKKKSEKNKSFENEELIKENLELKDKIKKLELEVLFKKSENNMFNIRLEGSKQILESKLQEIDIKNLEIKKLNEKLEKAIEFSDQSLGTQVKLNDSLREVEKQKNIITELNDKIFKIEVNEKKRQGTEAKMEIKRSQEIKKLVQRLDCISSQMKHMSDSLKKMKEHAKERTIQYKSTHKIGYYKWNTFKDRSKYVWKRNLSQGELVKSDTVVEAGICEKISGKASSDTQVKVLGKAKDQIDNQKEAINKYPYARECSSSFNTENDVGKTDTNKEKSKKEYVTCKETIVCQKQNNESEEINIVINRNRGEETKVKTVAQ